MEIGLALGAAIGFTLLDVRWSAPVQVLAAGVVPFLVLLAGSFAVTRPSERGEFLALKGMWRECFGVDRDAAAFTALLRDPKYGDQAAELMNAMVVTKKLMGDPSEAAYLAVAQQLESLFEAKVLQDRRRAELASATA